MSYLLEIIFFYLFGGLVVKMLKVNILKKLKEFDLEVDFELKKGCLGILGPSGCGKSMTLKSVAGIVNPDEGVVSLTSDEETVYFDSNRKINLKPQKRNVGYLFQNYALFPNMTVEENVAIGLPKNHDKNIVENMIKRFHLEGLELLDEPFSAMDTFLKEQLRIELVNSLKDFDGFSILVTHDRDEAFQFCDELIIMDEGKIIAKGDTYEIFENPKRVQVARLTGCKNISRIEVIDDFHLRSLDWGVDFEVSERISPDITHIGIRAHNFSAAEKDDVNVIDTADSTLLEMPFEWEVTLANGLWWKQDKRIREHEFVIPEYLKVDPKDIILLEE